MAKKVTLSPSLEKSHLMEEDATLVTREQYLEMLIDASCWDASEMESGFTSWCERHIPTWRQQGYDETWIRQRTETAQITRGLHRTLKEQGLTMLEIREELRKAYAAHPELYNLARARERLQPGLLGYRGNTGDLRQRHTLRVMIYDTEKLTFEKFCRWSGLPAPGPESVFLEQPDTVRVVRDLSTVEALELMLAMSKYALQLFAAPEHLTTDQIAPLMEAHGKQLRATFIARHGYGRRTRQRLMSPSQLMVPKIMMPIMPKNIPNSQIISLIYKQRN